MDPEAFNILGAALAKSRACAVIFADRGGGVRFWNAGAEALFGHSPAEVSGKRVDLIVPEEYRQQHWAGFARAIGSDWRGADAWGPVEALHKDGSRVAVEVFLTPVHGEDDRVDGMLAMFRLAKQE